MQLLAPLKRWYETVQAQMAYTQQDEDANNDD
jgi:hypothetical protein